MIQILMAALSRSLMLLVYYINISDQLSLQKEKSLLVFLSAVQGLRREVLGSSVSTYPSKRTVFAGDLSEPSVLSPSVGVDGCAHRACIPVKGLCNCYLEMTFGIR